ncbi:MAG: ABC transporter permease [Trueperaceae bacterium]|nr:MAG: ABC transporter permease [Trueperaceae bacterium]
MIGTTLPSIIDGQGLAPAAKLQSRPARPSAWSASLTLGWRALLKLKHGPSLLFEVTMFPILMTMMFTFIFGRALAGSITDYLQHLVPGILVMTVAMISQYIALGLNTDITKGLFDRFRSLPFWRPAVLVGALLGDMVRYSITAAVVIALGLILGFRPEGGPYGVLLSFGLVLVFAFSLSWIWTTLGLLMDDPGSVSMLSSLTTFPLTFVSNVFVDPATLPGFLQRFVNINPISLIVTAVRGAMHGSVTTAQIAAVFLSCAILIAIFAPLTMYLYNNKNAH